MNEPLFSPSWYRVAKLKPRLRGHAQIHRHEYRGQIWYVLQDHSKGRFYRFTPIAYHVIGRMNGRRTVQELWEEANNRFGDDAPTQQEMIHLLSQLHNADVLLCDVPPDTEELLRRADKIEGAQRKQNLRTPLAVRLPLLDPEKFLQRTVGLVRPFFSTYGAVIWMVVVSTAVVLAGIHWTELTRDVMDRVLSAQNLLIIGLAFPIVKALHEFGHGYAVKVWGGEVHEMGIMFLVFLPVPYVDASAASEFRARHRRVIVGAAGILVELFLASLALFLWLAVEPGQIRSLAYNVALIGSVSTLLFNGNPLLRYDGYYILADLLDIPNLAQRGQAYLGYLIQRYLFGSATATPPPAAPGERFWFVIYTVAAFVYRMFIYTAIVLFVAGKYFFIGILLALWAVFSMLVVPAFKGVKFIVSAPALRESRARALALTGAVVLLIGVLLFVAPAPSRTLAEGVIWPPEDSLVRAATDGFVRRLTSVPGTLVTRGQMLVEREDPLLAARVELLQARLDELQSRHDAALPTDPVETQIIDEEMINVRASLEHARERLNELEILSPRDGLFVVPKAQDLPGRYVRQGTVIGYVLKAERPMVRVVVPQSQVDLVRRRTESVSVRLAERLAEVVPTVIKREVPGAAEDLPSTILGSAGGGEIPINPADARGTKAFEKLFQFDLELSRPQEEVHLGGRVYVRFDHGREPIGHQIYRSIRQLFLRRFNV